MSEYKRFFSYIYAYEQNQKTSNAGFAKIEIKGPMTTIELHMRGTVLPAPAACLYLFVRNGETIQGFPLGDVPFSNGNADWRFTMNQPRLGDSDYEISDVSGILFLLEDNICFVSQWDEAPIDWSSFRIYEPVNKEENEKTDREVNKEADIKANKQQEEQSDEIDDLPSKENVITSAELPLPERKPRFFAAIQKPDTPGPVTEAPQLHAARPKTWSDTWQELLDMQTVRQPFPDESIRCVRIELKDLRVLPPSNWHLCNNSFLLHAYFTYRHLILGEITSAKNNRWFIGVPGIQYRQEHVLAAIFGFLDFLPEKESADADAPFGYWYRTISVED